MNYAWVKEQLELKKRDRDFIIDKMEYNINRLRELNKEIADLQHQGLHFLGNKAD